ncbi:PREDICTED: adrenocorticotropic hormone receptor-like [Acropora digitifera]|uniref:adrenocorticotropic hormone receptor-like n=1 Tax=Acropora digitifera TaxID=70779 RepID=UPI00077A9752|nr:PREDICTED: adrenocorticotropic hormone receptor-like [Acropora digitifera]
MDLNGNFVVIYLDLQTMMINATHSMTFHSCFIPTLPEETQWLLQNISKHVILPIAAILCVASIVANTLLVYIVTRTRSLQRPPMIMMCSLAITDIVSSTNIFTRIVENMIHPDTCHGLSAERETIFMLSALATLSNMAAISRERNMAVTKPLWYRTHVTSARAVMLASISWIISILMTGQWYIGKVHFPKFSLFLPVVFCSVCAFVIFFSYLGIFCQKTTIQEVMHLRTTLEREKRMANTLALILLSFLAVFLPGLIFPIILHLKGINRNLSLVDCSVAFLHALNGFLDPVLYFARNKVMRTILRRQINCSRKVTPRVVVVETLKNSNALETSSSNFGASIAERENNAEHKD